MAIHIKKTFKQSIPSFVDFFMLILGFFLSLSLVGLVKIPLHETYGISSVFNESGFNPDNNYTSLVFIIISTVVLGPLLSNLYRSKFRWIISLIVVLILTVNYVSLNMLADSTPAYASSDGYIDSFHGGEQLAPTQAFIDGQKLYSEVFFLRGAGVDVLFNAAGFFILGKSVGSFLLLGDVFIIISLVSFLVLLAYLVRNPILFSLLATIFFSSASLSILEFRDIVVWITFGLLIAYFKPTGISRYKHVQIFFIGLLSAISLYISIDRGVMLLATSVLLFAVLAIFSKKLSGLYDFSPKTWKQNLKQCLPLMGGLAVGVAVPAVIIGFDSFVSFIKMSFLEIPKFGGLLVSQPYPDLFGDTYKYWGPIFIAIATTYLLYKLLRLPQKNYNTLLPYGLILAFSILSLKIGSNRIALPKLATATTSLYLVAILILIFAVVLIYKQKSIRPILALPVILSFTTMSIFISIDSNRILQQSSYSVSSIKAYVHGVRKPDNELLIPNVVLVKNYIQSKTSPEDYIFSFTSNPMYHYAANRKNPSRFSISWFTDYQPYTTELLDSLKKNRPELIVYSDETWTDAPDGISMQQRIPEVDAWITENYPKKTLVGSAIILER